MYSTAALVYIAYDGVMPKEIITVRVDTQIKDIITNLADADDRTVSWIAEMLIAEALQS